MSKTTHLICILDRSGSMHGLEKEVISNFNKFLAEQKELEGKAKLTLAIFDTEYDLIYDEVDIKKAKPLTSRTYFPRGGTALRDAVGKTLTNKARKKKAIVMIHTDGWENASREYSAKDIKKLTNKLKKKWEFIFVGAGIDAAEANRDYGFTHTLNANASADSYSNQYDLFNSAATCYRSAGMAAASQTAAFVAEANANEIDDDDAAQLIDQLGSITTTTTTVSKS